MISYGTHGDKRAAPSLHPCVLHGLLQRGAHAPLVREGRAQWKGHSAPRAYRDAAYPRWTPPSVRPDLICGRDRPISPRSPWQNSYAERLIGTVRRECLDHVMVVGETRLRRIRAAYAAYCNQMRTHLALDKNVPLGRAVQRSGSIVAIPVLGGLHHQYARI